MEEYFSSLEAEAKRVRQIAEKARSKGLDPDTVPEIPFAEHLAARVEGLVGPAGVAGRIRVLSTTMS